MVNQEIFVKKAIVRIFKTSSKMEVHPQPVSPLESARPVIVSQQSLFIRPANVVHISTETSRSATIPCSFSFFHVLSDDPVHSHTASTLDRSARAPNVPLKAEEKSAATAAFCCPQPSSRTFHAIRLSVRASVALVIIHSTVHLARAVGAISFLHRTVFLKVHIFNWKLDN
ncbi:hypothetical protein C8J56DRAFT_1167418 [Mycena floridula]|nr:hypothetical protein C8J56DRAFT_1167418 [Mycena floridula]